MPSLQRSLRRGQILPWALSLSALILAPASLAQGRPSAPTGSATGAEGTCPSRAYFGDTHVHTGWSADAGMDGAITTPEDAFRFARGETVKSNTGRSARLARPRRRPERRTAGGLPASDLGARPCGGDGGGGLWGAVLVPPALWVLPVAFPMVMALGGLMGLLGIPLPAVEVGIALSGIVLGLMVLLEQRPPLWVAALRDSLAFVVSTGLLHLEGILLGETRRRPGGVRFVQGAGGAVALAGLFFLVQAA